MSLFLPGAGTTMLDLVEDPAPPGVLGEPPKAPPLLGVGTLTVGKGGRPPAAVLTVDIVVAPRLGEPDTTDPLGTPGPTDDALAALLPGRAARLATLLCPAPGSERTPLLLALGSVVIILSWSSPRLLMLEDEDGCSELFSVTSNSNNGCSELFSETSDSNSITCVRSSGFDSSSPIM